jgi:transcriptional regulator with XRE-family HTH domain
MMTFGQKLSFCRKEKKCSQAELGKLSGINGDIIGKYERDEMKPSIETAKKLSDALAVSLDYLVGDGDLKVVDKKTMQRLEDIEKLPHEDKAHIFYALDNLIKAAKYNAI